jgi:ribosomal protein RSM22 (predicted rRNA methylase)
MQLPFELREAMARVLEGISRTALAERAARLSEMYREGGASAKAIRDEMDALAYVVSRMPATYAAVRNAFGRLMERCPEFSPRSVLDLGAGPGTGSWAAVDAWPGIETVSQVDANAPLMRMGKALAEASSSEAMRNARRISADLGRAFEDELQADLVIVSYTLAELQKAEIVALLAGAWRKCTEALVVVEPGTPAGYERILRARDAAMEMGGRILAPCPHEKRCPLMAPDWCHFAQRVARSRDQMILKSATLGYEDEKFAYVIAVREELFHPGGSDRILARPDMGKAGVSMKLCRRDGSAGLVTIGRRDAEVFKPAKKRAWGDEI